MRNRGFSLAELSVAIFLMAVLSGASLWLLSRARAVQKVSIDRTDFSRDCYQQLQAVLCQLEETRLDSIAVVGGSCCSFLTARDPSYRYVTDSSASVGWQKMTVWRLDQGRLLQGEVSLGSNLDLNSPAWTPQNLSSHSSLANRLLMSNLSHFQMSLLEDGALLDLTYHSDDEKFSWRIVRKVVPL